MPDAANPESRIANPRRRRWLRGGLAAATLTLVLGAAAWLAFGASGNSSRAYVRIDSGWGLDVGRTLAISMDEGGGSLHEDRSAHIGPLVFHWLRSTPL